MPHDPPADNLAPPELSSEDRERHEELTECARLMRARAKAAIARARMAAEVLRRWRESHGLGGPGVAKMPADSHPTPAGRRLLRCDQCWQAREVTHADLMGFARDRWPKCCRQTMAYFRESERPTDAGTWFTHKCPVCGHQWSAILPSGVELSDGAGHECEACRRKAPAS